VWKKGVFLGVSHAPTARGRCPSAPQFVGSPSIYAHTLWRRTTKFDVVTHVGIEGTCFRVSAMPPRPHPNGAGFQRFPFLGVPFCLCVHALLQILGSATLPIPRERSSRAPNFWGSPVFMPTPGLWCRTTKFGMITHMGDGHAEVNHAILFVTDASRGLSATAAFLVEYVRSNWRPASVLDSHVSDMSW